MPWQHCGRTLADTDPCPECGLEKAQWTVEFEVTRTFQVKRSPGGVRVIVVDARERPLEGEPFRAELDDGRVVEGALDALGGARVTTSSACRVTFPRLFARDLAPHAQDGEEPAPPEVAVDAPATFVVAPGRALRLRRRPLHSARWSPPRARFDQAVTLIVGADLDDGVEVELHVFERDAGGDDDPVARLGAPVRGGRVVVPWHMPCVDDSDDAPTEVDRETGFALSEFVFVARQGEHEARCDDALTFATDLELPLRDSRGRALAQVDYVLRCGDRAVRGRTDDQGVLRERGVGPNFTVTLADGREVVVRAVPA